MNSDTAEPVPLWLEWPPNDPVPPPVQTLENLLPVVQLSWENFERLCLRLARESSDIEYCRLYGVRGQAQDGIDLYARQHAADTYTVYQCRKVKICVVPNSG